jgi:ubiquinone/menaquinone biosynthesis C-methylase UbiE
MTVTNIIKAVLNKILPKPVVFRLYSSLVYIKCFVVDLFDGITGKHDPLIPPTRYMIDYTPSIEIFKKKGEEYFKYYIELGGLKPDDKVLDVGCGFGEKNIPLAKYLNEKGKFEGIDIVKRGIDWCDKNITPKYPNFRFHLADVYNKQYNPTGKYKPSEYRFPYGDNTFNLVNLVSVFTHMMPVDIENYLKEIARVTKKGGKSMISYFILNDESIKLVEAGKSTHDFRYKFEGYRTTNLDIPEQAISFPEEYVRSIYVKNNLRIIEPIRYGSWCGRERFLNYQDLVIAEKE